MHVNGRGDGASKWETRGVWEPREKAGEWGRGVGQVKSRITLRDTWRRRQAGTMRPVRRAGWVWAVGFSPAAKICVGCVYVRRRGAKEFPLVLCCGGFLVPAPPG